MTAQFAQGMAIDLKFEIILMDSCVAVFGHKVLLTLPKEEVWKIRTQSFGIVMQGHLFPTHGEFLVIVLEQWNNLFH